jgi:hypothetical protein
MMTHRDDREETLAEFQRVVNMPVPRLREWLASDESMSVGMAPGGEHITSAQQHESVGHHMGQRILAIKAIKRSDLTDDDVADMRKVIGYVHRHLAQRPQGDVSDTRWRKSLMNWGHDPVA